MCGLVEKRRISCRSHLCPVTSGTCSGLVDHSADLRMIEFASRKDGNQCCTGSPGIFDSNKPLKMKKPENRIFRFRSRKVPLMGISGHALIYFPRSKRGSASQALSPCRHCLLRRRQIGRDQPVDWNPGVYTAEQQVQAAELAMQKQYLRWRYPGVFFVQPYL